MSLCGGTVQSCLLQRYDDSSPVNARIDEIVAIQVKEDGNMVVINGCLCFRPSEILHALDNIAYDDLAESLRQSGGAEGESDVMSPAMHCATSYDALAQ